MKIQHEKAACEAKKKNLIEIVFSELVRKSMYYINRTVQMALSQPNFRKSNVEECIFGYMASHIECRFNKNTLLQCYFLAILPAGYSFEPKFFVHVWKVEYLSNISVLCIRKANFNHFNEKSQYYYYKLLTPKILLILRVEFSVKCFHCTFDPSRQKW